MTTNTIHLGDLMPAHGDLIGELREGILSSLAAELAHVWRAQNPDAPQPSAYAPVTITLDHVAIKALAEAAARAAARRATVMPIPVARVRSLVADDPRVDFYLEG